MNGRRRVFWTRSGLDRLRDLLVEDRSVLERRALRLAVDEVLGDQRLRLGRALRVLAEHGERAGQLDLDERRLVLAHLEPDDRAGVHARDLHLGAFDEAEGVEHLELVGVRLFVGGTEAAQTDGAGGGERRGSERSASWAHRELGRDRS